ncbi:PHD and RING finger domain-containing protein 1 [Caerostris extrusa]|uniref:PHD and RING finger domain-containing protein 1 n=1 Tax=Caerostris extrusa TaxID=172846 RepID=A0AAV4WZ13_CAEEX|nr:PHD and RING finger domain-containing protein 1 [Caerostris extrusa]
MRSIQDLKWRYANICYSIKMDEDEASDLNNAEYYSGSDSDSHDDDNESESGSEGSGSEDSEISDDDDRSTEEDDEEPQNKEGQSTTKTSPSQNAEEECCPVCLNDFIGQDLGVPENCEHMFCLECIKEWAKNINTCPIDRKEFSIIQLKAHTKGKVLKKIQIMSRPKEPAEVMVCEMCHHGDREDTLLLCDSCDLAYHCECLNPPLFSVPTEEWFCPPCSSIVQNIPVPSISPHHRVIPRTGASENVRSPVQNRSALLNSPVRIVFYSTEEIFLN